ncbi:amidohydrolase family protein [Sporomusa acidovorans]|uniref:2-pyrone-4,6-dicarbaxylate hydrolase n=1 Tax=Sporomusa acidovorans (strain ATCC 49682 / DSM 3132 / Mol) TaxID=1123286 RepID=A0ABZ3J240_SPOA4|nr:amidohydrolase family protein [Sporomusa acidovorans]OZC16551.1 4-sulfomuconolactone hydrolase [Sporomusa acidovorans DSM 3132]SDF60931.1 Predicted metal-dependent hydrolase, TIM-barrel fold [Sporomusa acidovorans]
MDRRTFLKGAGLTLVGLSTFNYNSVLAAVKSPEASVAGDLQVPFSAGRKRPTIKVTANACDCHHHIYDPIRFPYVPQDMRNQPPATVDAYRLLQKRLGLTRNVIVNPSAYGTDNRCTLDALKQLGSNARAVVVVDPQITNNDLEKMHRLGVRGIRLNIARGGIKDSNTILALSSRVNELGWHIQFWMNADDTVNMEELLMKLSSPLVFDHRGHLPQPAGINHPAFKVICKLIDKGNTWVKLSGLYQDSKIGDPTYADAVEVGRAYVQYAPQRMVWGTDWPHPNVFSERWPWPDDANMLDLLAVQAPNEVVRNRILVENPATLYGFPQ